MNQNLKGQPGQDKQPLQRKKKPPACDRCKAKRVLCHPNPGGSCPRCIENSVVCTTMPVARKNASRKRQRTSEPEDELTGIGNATTCAAPMYDNTWQSNQYVPQAGPSSQPFTGPDESAIPSIPMQEQLPVATQRDSLIDHLLDLSKDLPPRVYCPILTNSPVFGPYAQWLQHIRYGYHPPLLAALVAFSSWFSSHPAILGQGARLPPCATLAADYVTNRSILCVDQATMVDAGVRRAQHCQELYETAKKLAWQSGCLAEPTRENAATCYLLDAIEITFLKRTKTTKIRPHFSAFLTMLSGLAEQRSIPHQSMIGFSMHEALTSFSLGTTPCLTSVLDNILSDVQMPSEPHEALKVVVDRLEGTAPHRINFEELAQPLGWYVEHVKFLARRYGPKLFVETPTSKDVDSFLANIEDLFRFSHIIDGRLQARPDLVRMFGRISFIEQHSPISDFQSIMQSSFKLPLASFMLPVYESFSAMGTRARLSSSSSSASATPPAGTEEGDLQEQLSRLAERALILLLSSLGQIPMMGYVAALPFTHLDRWADVMITLMKRPQSYITTSNIESMLSFLTVYSFSLPMDQKIVSELQAQLEWRKMQYGNLRDPRPDHIISVAPSPLPTDASTPNDFWNSLNDFGETFS